MMTHLAEQVESTADKWRLMHAHDLTDPLHERFDAVRVRIDLHSSEEQIEVHGLLRCRCEAWIEKTIEQCTVETVGHVRCGDLRGSGCWSGGHLEDELKSLDGDVECARVRDAEKRGHVLVEAARQWTSQISRLVL